MRFWNSYDELVASGYVGTVSIRNKVKDGTTNKVRMYEIPFNTLPGVLKSLEGVRELGLTEDPPNEFRTMQGEFSRIGGTPSLTYTFLKEPMYLAFRKEQLGATGWQATELLRKYCDPASYDWIQEATELYSDHTGVDTPVIEFTCFTINVGTIPHRNTVIWEIRNY